MEMEELLNRIHTVEMGLQAAGHTGAHGARGGGAAQHWGESAQATPGPLLG